MENSISLGPCWRQRGGRYTILARKFNSRNKVIYPFHVYPLHFSFKQWCSFPHQTIGIFSHGSVLLQAWEGRAYDYCMENLKNMGYPVDGLAFDPDLVTSSFPHNLKHLWIMTFFAGPAIFFFFPVTKHKLFNCFIQVIRGLVIDKESGNLVKADRFGYVKRAMHGTKMLSTRAVRYVFKTCQLDCGNCFKESCLPIF